MSPKSEKRAAESNKRLKKPVLDSCYWIIENDLCQSLIRVVLEFLSNGESLNRSSRHVSPKLSKITVACSKSVKGPNRINFDLPKVSKININFELLKVCNMTSLKIYISPVTEKLETSNLDSR